MADHRARTIGLFYWLMIRMSYLAITVMIVTHQYWLMASVLVMIKGLGVEFGPGSELHHADIVKFAVCFFSRDSTKSTTHIAVIATIHSSLANRC